MTDEAGKQQIDLFTGAALRYVHDAKTALQERGEK
jgi:hypothetical protein